MAEFAHADRAKKMRRIAIESALAGAALAAVAIVALAPNRAVSVAGASAVAASADEVYARLPPYPRPFTEAEMRDMHARLAAAAADLERARAATDDEIARLRALEARGSDQ